MSTVNGEGIRYCLFLSGCPFNCEGCHNTEARDYTYGDKEDVVKIFFDIYKKIHMNAGGSLFIHHKLPDFIGRERKDRGHESDNHLQYLIHGGLG